MCMHLTPCLNPRIVRNRYTGEKIMIPCGDCDACRNLRSFMWSQKISDEAKSWRYMMFVTLTYDEENCPLLFKDGRYTLKSLYRERVHKLNDGKFHSFPIDDQISVRLPKVDPKSFDGKYYRSRRMYPYVRFKDIQMFIKRLRSRISYYDKNEDKVLQKIIYFCASEYGSQTIRAHYHAIFFTNSPWVASNFRGLLDSSWLFGNRDFSFARDEEKSASYVAKYCCKSADLPRIYEDNQVSTFYTFSRSFAFGSHILSDEQIFQIFHDASPTCPRYDSKNQTFVDIPIYKAIENRIFPLLVGFDKLSVCARNQLYGLWKSLSYCTFPRFKKTLERLVLHPRPVLDWSTNCLEWTTLQLLSESRDYIQHCFNLDADSRRRGKDNNNALKSLYYCSRKVISFCENNSVSLYYYVKQIELYYKNKDAYRLKNQLTFEETYTKYHPACDLVWLYPAIVDDLNHGVCVSVKAFDYAFHQERFKFVPLQQTFDWKISAKENAELRKRSLKTEAVNESFSYDRFKTTISHFEIIED